MVESCHGDCQWACTEKRGVLREENVRGEDLVATVLVIEDNVGWPAGSESRVIRICNFSHLATAFLLLYETGAVS